MLQRILAPVDDPSETRVAIDLALALAAQLDAEVTLLHVIPPGASGDEGTADEQRTDTGLSAHPLDPLASTGNPQIEDEEAIEAQRTGTARGEEAGLVEAEPFPDEDADAARHVLERIASENAQNAHGDVPIAVAVTRGDPAAQILSMAHTASFDIVVMETRRSSAVARMVLGSTADEVARQSQVPVMLINPRSDDTHANPVAAPQAIVVPLDRSDESEHVIPLAQELAKRLPARVIFVHVKTSVPEATASVPGLPESHMRGVNARDMEAAAYLQHFTEASRDMGIEADAEVLYGDSLSAISGIIDSLSNPLVVLDASGKSKLHRLLAGSLSDQLVRKSGAPVLIAPEKLGAAIA